jgi:glutathione S-transferase
MKLIGSHSSPFVRKARIVLAEKRIDYDFVVDNPRDGASRVSDFNFRFADLDWRPQRPSLKRHAGKLFKRPPFEATQPRDPPAA